MSKVLTEYKAEQVLKKYLPIAKNQLVKKKQQAINFSKKLKFPIALKIISPQAVHKSDIGGVLIINSLEEIDKGFDKLVDIAKKKKLKLEGILVQEFIQGQQLIIGIKKDPTFNYVIMLGIGGIYVETLKDVTFRVCPITEEDSESMIQDLKYKDIILGTRGQKPVNTEKLKNILIKISQLPFKLKKISELDINPLIMYNNEAKVVDVRLVLD